VGGVLSGLVGDDVWVRLEVGGVCGERWGLGDGDMCTFEIIRYKSS